MKAVILAAGRGKRMGKLTENIPKPLLKIQGKTLLEYKMDVLPDECCEVILVIGYQGEQIKKYFGSEYNGRKIVYVETEPLGTGYALWQAREYLDSPFIVMCGDDLYSAKDILECIKYKFSALVSEISKNQSGGKIILDENRYILDIEEGNHVSLDMIATGLYVLSPEIFDLPLVKIGNGKDEYGLPQTLLQLGRGKIYAVLTSAWHQVTVPGDLQISKDQLILYT